VDSREICPEPNAENGWGTGFGDSNCNPGGQQAKWPSGHVTGPAFQGPSGKAAGSDNFYHSLCGPGSATFILSTWRPQFVAGYNGDVIKHNSNSFGIPKGWYRLFYREAYELMPWNQGANAAWGGYGWSTWWQASSSS
jgi:hypothetical protein